MSSPHEHSKKEKEVMYSIPLHFRKMENLHIVFWLFKDLSWCMIWKPLGIVMIFPTLYFAILITIRTRKFMSEICHNLAVDFWITANAYWMLSEFFEFDSHRLPFRLPLPGNGLPVELSYKHLAVIPFTLGILVLLYYYAWWKPRNKLITETM